MPQIQGETLREWRRSRGWDVPETARRLRKAAGEDSLPVHDALVRMIRRWEREGLGRRAERYELLYAKVLDIAPGELAVRIPGADTQVLSEQLRGETNAGSPGQALFRPSASPAISELCSVLTDYGFRLGGYASAQGTIRSPADLERDLEISYSVYQQSRYTAAASRVSALLADAQIALRECSDGERTRVLRVLALSYQVAASLLSKSGQAGTSWIAAERGLSAAEASGIPVVRCSLIRSVAFALLSQGHLESAMRLVESGAGSMEKEVTEDAAGLSVYGTLFLTGSMAAARFGDGPKTADYLQEAGKAASRLGRDANYLWTAFGPTNVAIHHVNTAVELGDTQTVLDHGMSLDTSAVPAERRVRYILDVARTHSLTGNRDDALGSLLAAERLAPEQTRQHYLTRRIIVNLMKDAKGRPPVQLGKLAVRAGLRVSALWQTRRRSSPHRAWRPARCSCARTPSSSSIRRMPMAGTFRAATWTGGSRQRLRVNARYGKSWV